MLEAAKLALRITGTAFDSEIEMLIEAAKTDLAIAGVDIPCPALPDAIVKTAIITYVKLHFGDVTDGATLDRLKKAYDEQKAQLSTATGYTNWGAI